VAAARHMNPYFVGMAWSLGGQDKLAVRTAVWCAPLLAFYNVTDVPTVVVRYLAQQLAIAAISVLARCQEREATPYTHASLSALNRVRHLHRGQPTPGNLQRTLAMVVINKQLKRKVATVAGTVEHARKGVGRRDALAG
jgi:hypothetical protein